MAKPTAKQLLKRATAACHRDEYVGFCLNCGAEKEGCEPDARNYHCDRCGEDEVYGAEEIVIMYA
jgi:hypothetical protein